MGCRRMASNLRYHILKYLMVDMVRADILALHQVVGGVRIGADSDCSQLLKVLASLRKENIALHADVRALMDLFDIPSSNPPTKEKQGDPHGL